MSGAECMNCDHASEQHIEYGVCEVSKCPCLQFVAPYDDGTVPDDEGEPA